MKSAKDVARELINSKDSNGIGVRAEAVTNAMKENNLSFKELWAEIVKQGNEESDAN
jgi:hypothetical protein